MMDPVEDLLLQFEDLTTCIRRLTLAINILLKTHSNDIEETVRDNLSQLIAKWLPPTKNLACQLQEQLKRNYDLVNAVKIDSDSEKVKVEMEDEDKSEEFYGQDDYLKEEEHVGLVGEEDTEEELNDDTDVFFDYTADDSVDNSDVDPLDHDPLDMGKEGHVALSHSSRKDTQVVKSNSEIEWILLNGKVKGNLVRSKVPSTLRSKGKVKNRKTRSCEFPGYKSVKCLVCNRHYGDERYMREHCRKKHLDFCIANPDLVCPPFSRRSRPVGKGVENINTSNEVVASSADVMRTVRTIKVRLERIDQGDVDIRGNKDTCDSAEQVISDDGDIEWKNELGDKESDKFNLSDEEWSLKTRAKLKDNDVDGSQNQTSSSCPVCNRHYVQERYMKEHCRSKHLDFCIANPDLVSPPLSHRFKRKENVQTSTEILTSRDMILPMEKVREQQMDHSDVELSVKEDKGDPVEQIMLNLNDDGDVELRNEFLESDKTSPPKELNTKKRDKLKVADNDDHEAAISSSSCPVCKKKYRLVRCMKDHCRRKHLEFCKANPDVVCPPFSRRSRPIAKGKETDNEDQDGSASYSSCPVCKKKYRLVRIMKEHCRKKHLEFCKANPDVVCPPFSRRSRPIGKGKEIVKTSEVVTSTDTMRTLRTRKVREDQILSDLDGPGDTDVEEENTDEESDKPNPSQEEWIPKKRAKLKLVDNDNDGSQKETLSSCPVCHRNYLTVQKMRDHCRLQHSDICKANPNILCPPLSRRSASNKEPIEIKKQGERFCCTTCTKTFSTKHGLIAHMNIHTGEKLFSCTQCGASFVKRYDRDRHYIRHRDPSFLCDLCPKTFKWEVSLIYHKQNEHPAEGEKLVPFLCTQCGALFKTKTTLATHTRNVHLKLRRYQCSLCPKRFKNSTHLKYHLKTHSNPGGRKRGLNREREETIPVRCKWNSSESNESTLKN